MKRHVSQVLELHASCEIELEDSGLGCTVRTDLSDWAV